MNRANWITGTFVASAAAGPIVVGLLALLATATSGMQPFGQTLGFLLFMLVFAFPLGFVISLVPNVAGTALLAWAGSRNTAVRHPLIWAASGFVIGGLISAAWFPHLGVRNAVLATVGLFCALICRWGTRWPDLGCPTQSPSARALGSHSALRHAALQPPS